MTRSFAFVCACAAFFTAAAPALADPDPAFAPGTYRQVNPATNRVLAVGNTVTIATAADGSLAFDLRAVRRLDLNNGEIRGTLPAGAPHATITQPARKCRLDFVANERGFVVSQDLRYGDCGAGHGVIASGIYVRATP